MDIAVVGVGCRFPGAEDVRQFEHLQAHCAPGALWRPLTRTPAVPPPDPDKVRAVALGHYQGRAVERYFPGREARRIVLLRDPVSLQLSYYNWRMLYFRGRGAGTYSFDLHLKAVPRNFMLHFLLRRWMGVPVLAHLAMPDARKLELVQQALAEFWFVGDSTDCDRVVAALAPALGTPPKAARRNSQAQLRDFASWKPLTVDDLTSGQRDRLLHAQALDQLLWETWRGAGFEPQNVVPAFANAWSPRVRWHDLARPLHEVARLARRAGRTPRVRCSALAAAPDDPAAWRDYLTSCRSRPAQPLPPELIGTAQAVTDAVLCALKAETLLCCRQAILAAPFQRRAPRLARTRLLALELVERLSAQDGRFRILVAEADAARDDHAWLLAAELYRQALALYPSHAGYRLQYAHCLCEAGKHVAAEIQYRSARALGAPWSEVAPPLASISARRDEPAPQSVPAPVADAQDLLDEPPTADDVQCLWRVAGRAPGGEAALLVLMRTATSIRAAIALLAAPDQADEVGRLFLADAQS